MEFERSRGSIYAMDRLEKNLLSEGVGPVTISETTVVHVLAIFNIQTSN